MKPCTLAEAATLGALLARPDIATGLTGWLRPSDFGDPWHAEVYRTMRHFVAGGERIEAMALGQELNARLGPTRADLARLAGLLRAAPPHPDPAVYAVMVLEAGLRRETAAQGVLLRAGALSAVLDGTGRPLHAVAGVVTATFDCAAARWDAVRNPGHHTWVATVPMLPGLVGTGAASSRDRDLSADRLLVAHPDLAAEQVAEREADLIAALIARPDHLPATAWLSSEAITNRPWRPVHAALTRMHADGARIDPVTVRWEIQRAARRSGSGPDVREVQGRVDGLTGSHPGYLAHLVAGDHLRIAADTAARSLHTAAANPGLDVEDVLHTGRLVIDALRISAAPLEPTLPGIPAATAPTLHAVGERDLQHGPVAG